jgi:elongator complex protein 4
VPKEIIDEAVDKKMVQFVESGLTTGRVLVEICKELERDTTVPLRICIPGLGSAAWGDVTGQVGCMMEVTKETGATNGK